ncbi:MAG: hypothetical protein HKN08_03610, partial [Gammaproteobacteria bacterium]|nr:hypothetical protein [Gammaproteobacteria bacterium]
DFTQARYILILLVFAYTAKALGTSLGLVLMITGNQGTEVRNAALVVTVNLLLNFTLVPKLGILGAAMATLTASVLFTLIRILSVKYKLSLRYPVMTIFRMIFIAYTAGLVIYYLLPMLLEIGVIMQFSILVIALSFATWKFSLSLDDRIWIKKILGNIK